MSTGELIGTSYGFRPLAGILEATEKRYLRYVWQATGKDKTRTAAALQISIKTVDRKLTKYEIHD